VNLIERSFSTVGNPITLAAYLTLMTGAAAALCFKAGSWAGRAPWLFALAVIGACWLYTDTRGAMLGVGVALPVILSVGLRRMGTVRPLLAPLAALLAGMAAAIVAAAAAVGNLALHALLAAILATCLALIAGMGLWLFQRGKRKARLLLVPLAILIVAGIAAAAYGNSTLPDRLTTSLASDPDVQVRLLSWRDAIPMILERPLLGHGPDNFAAPFLPHISEDLAAVSTGRIDKAHNDFLQVAATTGLLGLAAYLWVLVAYFRNVYRRGGWPLIALSGGVLAYILQLQTVFPSIDTNVAFWGVLGASVAVMRLHDRESEEEPETPPGAGSIGAALNTETPKKTIYELLVVVIVVGLLLAIAVPTFLNQRAVVATFEQAKVTSNIRQTVSVYEQTKAQYGTYPDAGVYYQGNPVKVQDAALVYPFQNVVITTTTTPKDGFTVEGESDTLVVGQCRMTSAL